MLNPFSKVDISFDDFRLSARKRLPKLLFEYIDGAASDGSGEAENRRIIKHFRLKTKALINVIMMSNRSWKLLICSISGVAAV